MCEIVYPTSRAVELDEDDEEERTTSFVSPVTPPIVRLSPTLHTTFSRQEGVSCKLLLVAFGRIATTFIEGYFLHSDTQIVGVVIGGKKEKDVNSVLQTEPSDKTCFIHSSGTHGKNPNEVLFCQSKVDYPAVNCHDWPKEIMAVTVQLRRRPL